MSDQTSLTPETQQVETLLGQLSPMSHGTMRDRLMFEAGKASVGQVRVWQGVSGVFAVLLLCSLMIRTVPQTPPTLTPAPQLTVHVEQAVPERDPANRDLMPEQAYLRLRSRVLTLGVDALPEMKRKSAVALDYMSYDDVLDRMMNM